MSVRTVQDAAGLLWQVWEVVPGRARTAGPVTGRMPNVWGGAAALTPAPVAAVDTDGGWLVFMHDEQRCRLSPIPSDWAALDDARLLRLLDDARRGTAP